MLELQKHLWGDGAGISRRSKGRMVIIYGGMVSAKMFSGGMTYPSTRVLATSAAYSMTQGRASFSHEEPDLEKPLKPRAAR